MPRNPNLAVDVDTLTIGGTHTDQKRNRRESSEKGSRQSKAEEKLDVSPDEVGYSLRSGVRMHFLSS